MVIKEIVNAMGNNVVMLAVQDCLSQRLLNSEKKTAIRTSEENAFNCPSEKGLKQMKAPLTVFCVFENL